MTVLAIETSSCQGTVAALSSKALLFSQAFSADRANGGSLFPVLARAMSTLGCPDRIVVGLGPGSYAGVRIAISAAVGLDLAQRKRGESAAISSIVGIPSAASWKTGCAEYIAIGDARRETFYWTHVRNGECVEGPALLDAAEMERRLGSARVRVFACESLPAFPDVKLAAPSAETLGALAFSSRGIVASGLIEPIYLREAYITQPRDAARGSGPAAGS